MAVVGVVDILLSVVLAVLTTNAGIQFTLARQAAERELSAGRAWVVMPEPASIVLGLCFLVAATVFGGSVVFSALKTKRLESYGWAIAGSILAMLSPCFPLGQAVGIWALVVLSRPEVRAAFRRRTDVTAESAVMIGPSRARGKSYRWGLAPMMLALTGILAGAGLAGLLAVLCVSLGQERDANAWATDYTLNTFSSEGRISAAEQGSGAWIGRLPQGTVELRAICPSPDKEQVWWRPDGSPYGGSPINLQGYVGFGTQPGIELVFAFEGLPKQFSAKLHAFPPITRSSYPTKAESGNWQSFVETTARTGDVAVGMAAGPWQTVAHGERWIWWQPALAVATGGPSRSMNPPNRLPRLSSLPSPFRGSMIRFAWLPLMTRGKNMRQRGRLSLMWPVTLTSSRPPFAACR